MKVGKAKSLNASHMACGLRHEGMRLADSEVLWFAERPTRRAKAIQEEALGFCACFCERSRVAPAPTCPSALGFAFSGVGFSSWTLCDSECPVLNQPHSFVPKASGQMAGVESLCFAYFHLGPQMKVGRPSGETVAPSRSEKKQLRRATQNTTSRSERTEPSRFNDRHRPVRTSATEAHTRSKSVTRHRSTNAVRARSRRVQTM